MKLSLIASVSAFTTENRVSRDVEEKGEKRYKQLAEMMGHYNSDFDEKKYWAYGCHCFKLGDRPMAEMGKGKPIDALDSACKAWKECQRCARMKHNRSASHPQGEFECLGEFTRYNFDLKNDDYQCKNSAGSCSRDLCECDLAFAKAHALHTGVWKIDNHAFYGDFDKDDEANCEAGSGPHEPKCCQSGDYDTAFIWYNSLNKQCCADGTVIPDGEMC